MMQAVYRPSSRDTVAEVGGQRVPLSQAAPTVTTGANADWYIRGTPFTVTLAPRNEAQFITQGGVRSMSANDLVYMGDVGGMPVYGDADDVAAFRAQLDQARTQRGNDLQAILAADSALRTRFDDLAVIYVPIRPVGCVFQPLQRQEPVRKGLEELLNN